MNYYVAQNELINKKAKLPPGNELQMKLALI